jgi:hypothetical protein
LLFSTRLTLRNVMPGGSEAEEKGIQTDVSGLLQIVGWIPLPSALSALRPGMTAEH